MSKEPISKKKYYLFDCRNFILGRMSAKVAHLLRGKNRADFAPNKECDNRIIVINSDKLQVSGAKRSGKKYHLFSGYPGGITSRTLEEMLERDSRKVVWNSVYGMLPKNKLRDRMMKKLLILTDEKHGIKTDNMEEIKP